MKYLISFIISCLSMHALAAPALPVNTPQEKFESYYPASDSGYDFGTFLAVDSTPKIKSSDDADHPKVATEAVVDSPNFKPEEIPDDMNLKIKSNEGNSDAFVISDDSEAFMPPPNGEKPKFTGSFVPGIEFPALPETKSDSNEAVAVVNPAAYYLEGAKLDKIKPAKCSMLFCDGPVANDGDVLFMGEKPVPNKACHQAFVPLNGCTDNKGYPVGMVCTICCDCNNDFIAEIKNSRGYKEKYFTK